MRYKLILFLVVFSMLLGCGGDSAPTSAPSTKVVPMTATLTATSTDGPTATTPTEIGTPSITELPVVEPSSTPPFEEMGERVASAYVAIAMIQFNAEITSEIADGLASGELDTLEAGAMRLGAILSIQVAEDAIQEVAGPPDVLTDIWENALGVHEATKDVMSRWFNGKIDSGQVVAEMSPILQDANVAISDAENVASHVYNFDAEELKAKREETVKGVRATLGMVTPEPTTTPVPPTPTPQSTHLGDLVEQYGYSLSATAVENPTILHEWEDPAPTGYKAVAVEVIVGNISAEQFWANKLHFTLVDHEGFAYPNNQIDRAGENNFPSVDIGVGEKARGWVAFMIPEGATPTYIKYEAGYNQYITVGLLP